MPVLNEASSSVNSGMDDRTETPVTSNTGFDREPLVARRPTRKTTNSAASADASSAGSKTAHTEESPPELAIASDEEDPVFEQRPASVGQGKPSAEEEKVEERMLGDIDGSHHRIPSSIEKVDSDDLQQERTYELIAREVHRSELDRFGSGSIDDGDDGIPQVKRTVGNVDLESLSSQSRPSRAPQPSMGDEATYHHIEQTAPVARTSRRLAAGVDENEIDEEVSKVLDTSINDANSGSGSFVSALVEPDDGVSKSSSTPDATATRPMSASQRSRRSDKMDDALLESISNNQDPKLTRIRLSGKKLSDEDARSLAECLQSNTTISSVDLSDNAIGNAGFAAIIEALHASSAITTLDFARNRIDSVECLQSIRIEFNKKLEELDLSENYLGLEAIHQLSEGLQPNSSVTRVDLSNNQVDDEGAESLANLIRFNSTLRELVLKTNIIGPKGAEALASAMRANDTLRLLNLRSNKVGDEGVEGFAKVIEGSERLTDIDFSRNGISSSGAKRIAKALAFTKVLCTLNLGGNRLGNTGSSALARGLKENDSVSFLDLASNDITDAQPLIELVASNSSITTLNLRGNVARVPATLLNRNRALRDLREEYEKRGPCLFVEFDETEPDDGDGAKKFLRWTLDMWGAVKLNNIKTWTLIHRALLACCSGPIVTKDFPMGREEILKACQDRSQMKDLIDNVRFRGGKNLLHCALESQHNPALRLSKLLVNEYDADFDEVLDASGFSAREIGVSNPNPLVQVWSRRVGLFLSRYRIAGGMNSPPVYKSSTLTIFEAEDSTKTSNEENFSVMVAIINGKRNFLRELACRLKVIGGKSGVDLPKDCFRFSSNSVLPMIRHHDEREEDEEGKSSQTRVIILPKYDRTLQQVIRVEYLAGHDVDKIVQITDSLARTIQHIHSKRMVHCNIYPPRIVRHENSIKLVGFELAVGMGRPCVTNRQISAFCAPELARTLFQSGNVEQLRERVNKLRRDQRRAEQLEAHDDERMCSLLLETVQVKKRLDLASMVNREEPPLASAVIDIWSFGVVFYQLLTGESLFPENAEDCMSDMDDQLELATWKGLKQRQLDRVLVNTNAKRKTINRAKKLLLACLEPDPEKRPQSMDEVLSFKFFSPSEPEAPGEKSYRAVAPNMPAHEKITFDIDEAPESLSPQTFIIVPFELERNEDTGKWVPPDGSQPFMDTLIQMQEFNVLQQLLNSKLSDDPDKTRKVLADAKSLPRVEGSEEILRHIGVHPSSFQYFLIRISDLNTFREHPLRFLEHRSGEHFHDWWSYFKESESYFYIVDEYYQNPVIGFQYPIEIPPNAATLRDLIPFLCLNITSVPILTAVSYLSAVSNLSLPSRIKETAMFELDRLNMNSTLNDYQVLRQAFDKLAGDGAPQDSLEDDSEKYTRFDTVQEARAYELEAFYEEYEPERDFAGLVKVTDGDGIVRWTTKEGKEEIDVLKHMSMLTHFGRKRRLEESLREVEKQLKIEELKFLHLTRERDVLKQEKEFLLDNKQKLEDYIAAQRRANEQCCTIS